LASGAGIIPDVQAFLRALFGHTPGLQLRLTVPLFPADGGQVHVLPRPLRTGGTGFVEGQERQVAHPFACRQIAVGEIADPLFPFLKLHVDHADVVSFDGGG